MSMIQEQNESSDTSDIYDRSEVYDQSVSSDSSVLPDSADMSDSADFSDYDSSDPMVEVLENAFIEADDDIDDEVNADPTASIADENFTSTDKISIYRPLKFCLNDRFRFVRTLFENDNDRFNDVSESLSKFDTCDEALDWLDREMSWDVEDPEVADFRELVSIYFQQNR